MKPVTLLNALFLFLFVVLLFSCQQQGGGGIPFNREKAQQQVRPYDSLTQYINAFTQEKKVLYRQVQDTQYFRQSFNLPSGEMFNRDAIIALLNAPGAENIRVYLGKKPNGEIVFVLMPVDKDNNDLKVRLLDNSRQTGLTVPGISSANAAPNPEAQAVEDGQRCPTICGFNSDLNL